MSCDLQLGYICIYKNITIYKSVYVYEYWHTYMIIYVCVSVSIFVKVKHRHIIYIYISMYAYARPSFHLNHHSTTRSTVWQVWQVPGRAWINLDALCLWSVDEGMISIELIYKIGWWSLKSLCLETSSNRSSQKKTGQVKFEENVPNILLTDGSEILRSPVDMVNIPIIYRASCISGGAGCLPSTGP